MPLVTEDEIRRFEADGAICVREVIPPEWIENLRHAVDRELGQKDPTKFQQGHNLMWRDEDIRAFVFGSPAARLAREIMRSDTVRYYFDQLFVKEPGVEQPTPWHHDAPYWPVSGRQVCSVWIPLDPVTKANSGLEYVRGSHLWGKEYSPVAFDPQREANLGPSELEAIPDIEGNREEYEFLNGDMQPGDCLVHQARTIHGASGNTTREHRRRAFSIRWLGDDARYRKPGLRSDPYLPNSTSIPGEPIVDERFPYIELAPIPG